MTAFLLLAETAVSKSQSPAGAPSDMTGLVVMLITFAVFWCIWFYNSKKGDAPAPPEAAPAVARVPASAAAPAEASRIAPEIVAVIAAAVATVSRNQPIRIVSIKPMSSSWERAGRQSVLTSHRIR